MKIVDMHCDTILKIYDDGGSLLENDFNIDLKKIYVRSNIDIDVTKTTTFSVKFSGNFDVCRS